MANVNAVLLFEACRTRFIAKTALAALGRKLSMTEESTHPWTEFEILNHDTLDGFEDDIEIWTCQFTYHGKNPQPDNASTWLEEMTDAFDDFSGLSVSGYTTTGVNRLAADEGPELIDKHWEARAVFEILLHRNALLPAVRGA